MARRIATAQHLAEQVEMVDERMVQEMAKAQTGPFAPHFRVACPARMFGRRRTSACALCPHRAGLGRKAVAGAQEPSDDPDAVSRLYTVACTHPVWRAVRFFPED